MFCVVSGQAFFRAWTGKLNVWTDMGCGRDGKCVEASAAFWCKKGETERSRQVEEKCQSHGR